MAGRPPEGARALTVAERQARRREVKAAELQRLQKIERLARQLVGFPMMGDPAVLRLRQQLDKLLNH